MRRLLVTLSLTGLLAPIAPAPAHAQSQAGALAAAVREFPRRDEVDFAGIDEFYKIADILTADRDPSPAQWQALMSTGGYRMADRTGRQLPQLIAIALKPSMRAARDSAIHANEDVAGRIAHIARAVEKRQAVLATRDALTRTMRDSLAAAKTANAKYLPAGTAARFGTPMIGFAVFADDGFAMEDGVLLDPLEVHENGLVMLLAHELHHSYTGILTRSLPPSELRVLRPVPPDLPLFAAIMHLRNEGIADQVDKPVPLKAWSPEMEPYAKRYNDVYAKTPATLRTFDSLVVAIADNPATALATAQRINSALFWSNGHANGAYMAREIADMFGPDSLIPAIYNPFALLKTYARAEAKRGNPPPFSARTVALLDSMEKFYIKER